MKQNAVNKTKKSKNPEEKSKEPLLEIIPGNLHKAWALGQLETVKAITKKFNRIDLRFERTTYLHMACSLGHEELAKHLMTINNQLAKFADDKGNTPLHIVAEKNLWALIEPLLIQSHSRSVNSESMFPFYLALKNNHLEMAVRLYRWMRDNGLGVNTPDNKGRTQLHIACENNDIRVAGALVTQYNANLYAETEENLQPIDCALKFKHIRLALWLFDQMVESKTTTLLHRACSKNFTSAIEIILQIDPSAARKKNSEGETSLYMALREKKMEALELLLQYDSIEGPDKDNTYLQRACTEKNLTSVEFLVANGANVTVTNKGKAPLTIACELGLLEIAKVLVEKIKAKNIKYTQGATPLHHLCSLNVENHHFNLVKLIVDSEINDINAMTARFKYTPLYYIIFRNTSKERSEIIKFLLAKGANPNAKDHKAKTLLHYLCEKEIDQALLNFLWDKKINIETQDDEGVSPLHVAVREGKTEHVKWLLRHKADPNSKDNNGNTPSHYLSFIKADSKDIDEMLLLLREFKANFNKKNNEALTPVMLFRKQLSPNENILKMLESFEKYDNLKSAILVPDFDRMKLLVTNAIEADYLGSSTESWIHLAFNADRPWDIHYLLKIGADANARDSKGKTLLEKCIEHQEAKSAGEFNSKKININYEELIERLLGHSSVDVFLKTSSNEFLICKAMKSRNVRIINLLSKKMSQQYRSKTNIWDEVLETITHIFDEIVKKEDRDRYFILIAAITHLIEIANKKTNQWKALIKKIFEAQGYPLSRTKEPFLNYFLHTEGEGLIRKMVERWPADGFEIIKMQCTNEDNRIREIGYHNLLFVTKEHYLPCEDLIESLSKEGIHMAKMAEEIRGNLKQFLSPLSDLTDKGRKRKAEENGAKKKPKVDLAPSSNKKDKTKPPINSTSTLLNSIIFSNHPKGGPLPRLNLLNPTKSTKSGAKKPKKYSDQENYKEGHDGERLINDLLREKYLNKNPNGLKDCTQQFFKSIYEKNGRVVEVEIDWCNAYAKTIKEDSKKPYDIKITKKYYDKTDYENKEVRKLEEKETKEISVEVKTTRSKEPTEARFSGNELEEMLKKKENYLLYRIRNLKNDEKKEPAKDKESERPIVTRYKNPPIIHEDVVIPEFLKIFM